MIDGTTLLKRLQDSITPPERAALKENGLVISRYNRATLLRLLAMDGAPDNAPIDFERLEALKAALQEYLNRYMPDRPEGHKWIVLSCLFLAFVVREPLHPREIVGWKREDGMTICPAREVSADSLCRWCVCRAKG